MKQSICSDWEFVYAPEKPFFEGSPAAGGSIVRLPHTVRELPLHYADPEDYTGVFGYRKTITVNDMSKRYLIRFDGAAHSAMLYVNGEVVSSHFCGYTAFETEITKYLHEGSNLIAVKLDTSEDPDVPPFGFVMDYLGYGGLYREAWLEIREQSYIEDVFVSSDGKRVTIRSLVVSGEAEGFRFTVKDGDRVIASDSAESFENGRSILLPEGVEMWSPETPKLYVFTAELLKKDGSVVDSRSVRFGARTVEFRADGLYLNGKKYFMRGLNRHQSWPYIGYAAPASLQREDARILKEELCVNAVRTSHYPQSHSFIDACDELGILVFTEIPGWQHIGDEAWKVRSIKNAHDMVLQYRNHPSIVLWGVRINESADDDDFYKCTNTVAHDLDPTRATSGVRYLEKSSLLEDVYAYNDFSHSGGNAGCRPKKAVTSDMNKAFLISEHNGHMFPTKPFDNSARRQENALRHAKVLDAAYSSGEHAGCFGWCMFDYATHKDFGSGDRICYHGVMDSFRNPKLSAAVYASQGELAPVLEVGSAMQIGDYNAGNLGEIFIFTNADEVVLYKNGERVKSFFPKKAGLPHPPIELDDLVGELLNTQEGLSGKKEKLIHDSLLAAAKYGMDALPLKYKLKMAECMLGYGLKYEDGLRLYHKYIGNWGGEITCWRLEAVKDGRVVLVKELRPSRKLKLEVKVSNTVLHEGDIYDMAAVRVRLLDENGSVASYAQLPIRFELEGGAELVGPETVTAEGGMCGTYVRTAGKRAKARLTISCAQTEPAAIDFVID
ncbi:MAG: glycoside hydrolase family 2 protein [Clostridia bacterium]|nr:glycoside hydrolase family 2 protein [Clostridia bacterium]